MSRVSGLVSPIVMPLAGPVAVDLRIAATHGVGGVFVPSGFILIVDSDGAYLTDADGAYLMEPV